MFKYKKYKRKEQNKKHNNNKNHAVKRAGRRNENESAI